MAVVMETTLGDLTVDLFVEQRPQTCLNFLKLCKMKYYNFSLFHSIQSGFLAQAGDPTGSGSGGESIWGLLEGKHKRYFKAERVPKIRHSDAGMLSMVCLDDSLVGSQFFFTLGANLDSLDSMHCVIGIVTEGHDVLRQLNEVICDETYRPYRDVRVTHTVVLEDPYNDPPGLYAPDRSPSPSAERLIAGRIAPDEELDETQGKTIEEINEFIEKKEAKARATILEIVGDLPDADVAPPENVLFVCKLNPVTTDSDLEIIFSRFGKIVNCEVIRDKKSGDSLQYAFIEFEDQKSCENAYFKMDNVLIDDRRIHVDFSQSVSKVKWLGKGRGVKHEEVPDTKKSVDQTRRQSRSRDRDNKSGRRSNSRNRDDRQRRRSKSRGREDKSRRRSQSRDRDRRSRTEREDRKRYKDKEGSNRRSQKSKSRSPISRSSTKHSGDSSRNQDRQDKIKELSDNHSKDKYRDLDYSVDFNEDKTANKNGDASKLFESSKKEKKYPRESERDSFIDNSILANTEMNHPPRKSGSLEQPETEFDQPFRSKLSRSETTTSQKDDVYLKGNTKKISKSPKNDMELSVHPKKSDGNYKSEDRMPSTKNMQVNENREENERRNRKESSDGSHKRERVKDSENLRSDRKSIVNRESLFTQGQSSSRENLRKSDGRYKREDRLSSTKNMQDYENRDENERRNLKEYSDGSQLQGLRHSELLRSDKKSFDKREGRSIQCEPSSGENNFPDQIEIHKKSSGVIKEDIKGLLVRNEEKSLSKHKQEEFSLIHSPRSMRADSTEEDKSFSQQCRNQSDISDFVKGQRRSSFSKRELDSSRDMREENLRERNDFSDLRRKQKYALDASKGEKESLPRKEKEYSIDIQRRNRTEQDCTDHSKTYHKKEKLPKNENDEEMREGNFRQEGHQSDRRRIRRRSEVSEDEIQSLLPRGERKHSENYSRKDVLPAGDTGHDTWGKNISDQRNTVIFHNVDLLSSKEKQKRSTRERSPFEQSALLIRSTKVRDVATRENDKFSDQLIKQRDTFDRSKVEIEPGGDNRLKDYLVDRRQEAKMTDNSRRNKVSRREEQVLTKKEKESYGRVSLEPTRRVENSVKENVFSSDRHPQFFEHSRRGRNSDHSRGTSENSRRGLEYLEDSKGERVSLDHSRRDFEYLNQSRDEAEIVDHPNRELVFSENSRGERFVRSRWDTDYFEETRQNIEPPRSDLIYSDNARVERVPVPHSRWDTDYPEESRDQIESIEHPSRHLEYLKNARVEEHHRRDLELIKNQRGPADHTNLEYFEHSRGEGIEHSRREEYSNNLRERVSVEYPRRDLGYVEISRGEKEHIERFGRDFEYLEDSRLEMIHPEHPLRNNERFDDSRGGNTLIEQRMVRKETFENPRKLREQSSHSGPDRCIRPESPRREMEYFENSRMENIAFSDRVRHPKETDEHSMRTIKRSDHFLIDQKRSRNKIEVFGTDDNPTNSQKSHKNKNKDSSDHFNRDKTSEQYKTGRENIKLEPNQSKVLLQSSRRENVYSQHSKVKSLENYKGDKDVKAKSRMDDISVKTSDVKKDTTNKLNQQVEPIRKQKSRVTSSKDKIKNMSTEFEATEKSSRTDGSSDRKFDDRVKHAETENKRAHSQSKDAHLKKSTKSKELSIRKAEVKKSQRDSINAQEDSKAKVKKTNQKEPKKSRKFSKEKIKKLAKRKKLVVKKKGKESSSSSSNSSDISTSSSTDSSSSESDHKKKSIKKRRRKRKVSTSSSSSSDTSSSSTSDTDSSSESSSSSTSSESESTKRPKKKSVPDKKKVTPKIKNKDKT